MSLAVEAEGSGLDAGKLEVQHIANESQGEGAGIRAREPHQRGIRAAWWPAQVIEGVEQDSAQQPTLTAFEL
jgi:hypothetical protein